MNQTKINSEDKHFMWNWSKLTKAYKGFKNPLEENTAPFLRGGTLSRKNYLMFLGHGALTFFMLGFTHAAIFTVLMAYIPTLASAYLLTMTIVTGLPLGYSFFINTYKRLRDIRGTIYKQNGWQIFISILFLIPVISFFTLIWISAMPQSSSLKIMHDSESEKNMIKKVA